MEVTCFRTTDSTPTVLNGDSSDGNKFKRPKGNQTSHYFSTQAFKGDFLTFKPTEGTMEIIFSIMMSECIYYYFFNE